MINLDTEAPLGGVDSSFYRANIIDVKVPSIAQIFATDVFTPFYLFQLFSVIVWYIDEYEIYASSILATTLLSIIMTIYTIRSARIEEEWF